MAWPPEDVVPLPEGKRVALPRPRPRPAPLQTRRDERAALAESLSAPVSLDDALDSGEELAFVREGLGRDVLRRLRRGHWVVQGELDLHGMNRGHALFHTDRFLKESVKRQRRCVRIVHGKGLGSRNREPVLKGLLRKWLVRRSEVLAFAQAPGAQGGSGAVLVLLRG
ncbi:MAG TPA: Smr/MutS family protein [Burkholderiales bacterium]